MRRACETAVVGAATILAGIASVMVIQRRRPE